MGDLVVSVSSMGQMMFWETARFKGVYVVHIMLYLAYGFAMRAVFTGTTDVKRF